MRAGAKASEVRLLKKIKKMKTETQEVSMTLNKEDVSLTIDIEKNKVERYQYRLPGD